MSLEDAQVVLGTVPTPTLIAELTNRQNIIVIVGVRFIDGSGLVDEDVTFCGGSWPDIETAREMMEDMSDYVEEAEDFEEPEGRDD